MKSKVIYPKKRGDRIDRKRSYDFDWSMSKCIGYSYREMSLLKEQEIIHYVITFNHEKKIKTVSFLSISQNFTKCVFAEMCDEQSKTEKNTLKL